MTGFGRGVATTNSFQLTVEIRAVNHRFLELSTKFPKDWLEAEVVAKKLLSAALSRGKVDVNVYCKELQQPAERVHINWQLLDAFIEAKNQLSSKVPMNDTWSMQEMIMLDKLFIVEKEELQQQELVEAVQIAMEQAIANLLQMREREGEDLRIVMLQYKKQLQQQMDIIRLNADGAVDKYRDKLLERLQQVASGQLLEERLLTEVALFAERIDITEELDRLGSHFQQLEGTLSETVAIGRKLDFLMQEMHREINTIGSKNQSAQCSMAVVQAKTILEKMREQVQNIE